MPYSFTTTLLSAQKTGSPNLIGTQLSAFGVNVISLSTDDKGIAFNPKSNISGVLTTLTVQGSIFRIDRVYDNEVMALVKVPSNNISTYTTFFCASAAATPSRPLSAGETDVIDQDGRRKWVLGYV